MRDSRKYDTFRGKQAVLFINLLGKGLTVLKKLMEMGAPFDGLLPEISHFLTYMTALLPVVYAASRKSLEIQAYPISQNQEPF